MGGMEKLFGKGKYKIISVFLENIDEPLHFREVCRCADMTQPTVLEHLKVLTEIGFLKVKKNMNQTQYTINHDNPITKKIIALFEK